MVSKNRSNRRVVSVPRRWAGFALVLCGCAPNVDTVGEGDEAGECSDGIDNDGDSYIDEKDAGCPEIEQTQSPTALVVWDVTGVRVELSGTSENGNYSLGIAETSGECLNDGDCWTGEDCFQGFTLEDGGRLLYCHPFYASSSLALEYGALPDTVNEGESTAFSDSSFQSLVTYVLNDLRSSEEGSCWVWGADTLYYDEHPKRCVEL